MKEETKFLIEIADRFDNDAQDVLDFVAKNGNLEKAAKALAGAGKPTVSVTPPTITCPERSDLGKLPDGVYSIAGATEGEVNTKTYAKYDPSMTAAPFPTKYIGVKLGHRTVAVALEDLPGDKYGELQLLPSDHTSPETSEHYCCDDEADPELMAQDYEGFPRQWYNECGMDEDDFEHIKEYCELCDKHGQEAVDDVIDRLCPGEYIAFKDFELYSSLPYCGLEWNSFLLESYVAKFSRKFKLIHPRYNQDVVPGAIVKREVAINDFEDFLANIVGRSEVQLNKEAVLNFLQEKGYIARRRMSNIENLIIKARLVRNQLKTEN